ncbi:Biotin-protein ligase [Trichoderma simmonsii]|uniref:Biotin-protein ligase n=1 Tax=Trichoderma simmonsii TaxID=1491479 RepID=A0A8G0LAC8_9HYPO|nr:Biotin-protein ligase [Trichoderma simmonsii]
MAPSRLNILVHTGTGTTAESVRHCMYSLRRLLSPNYAIIPINETALLKEPWAQTCALLVFPGGADLGYCRVFNGKGNRRISEFVRRGGAYLGLCAGGYYGSSRCEFEVGNKALEVIGSRELGFFPGTCRGGAFKGFEYKSEKGARAATIKAEKQSLKDKIPGEFAVYYNGGGVFVDANATGGRKIEILASYKDDLDVDGGDEKAAVVLCHVGEGKAILSGPHPEFAPANLNAQPDIPGYSELVDKLAADDNSRTSFLKALLSELGLEVVQDDYTPPSLSSLHLTALESGKVTELLCDWGDAIEKENGNEYIRGEADTFQIINQTDGLNLDELASTLPQAETMDDPSSVIKKIIPHETKLPSDDLTPRFNHERFYSSLKKYRKIESSADQWGDVLLYGDVVTSTNTLLEKNPKLNCKLPTGFTFTATTQIAGRGRGSNVWVAPPGSLLFSTVINHPAHLAASRPIVFIQYIAAVAIVEAIRSYDTGYDKMPVKLKWPNDIYALDPTKPASSQSYVKIGGILSQCSYFNGAYQVVLGIGINATNPRPTTSLSDLLPQNVAPFHIETLLARILTRLEAIYEQFRREGFSQDLESRYYRHWLHTGQAITLEAEGGVKARVLGITRDWGMLRVEETDSEGRGNGKVWSLQSDENSFDYWKGLVRRKT